MQKNLALIAKYFKRIYKPTKNNLRTSSNSRNKNVDTIPRYKNDNQSGQFRDQRTMNVDGARENECRKPKRVKDSAYHKEKMLCKQADKVETDDSNVIPDSPDMCEDHIQNDQNDVKSDDERVALANLIANLKIDVDENKKIQNQLKKANTTLAQELKECKTILAETSKTLRESNNVRKSCLVALQNKQTEFEKYKAFNDHTVDYEKLELSKEKRSSFKLKVVPNSKGRLNLLHMDLCGPMRVASINGKKYILENAIESRNRTLVEAARTMLLASKLPLFFWAEAIATACYTQNRSIIILTHDKMAHHIINDRKPSIKHLYIFGCICYLTRDGENLDKMKEKEDPCILVGYSTQLKGYHVYNKRTKLIVESIHIRFDEIKEISETSAANDTLGLVPQRQKALDYDNFDPVTQLQIVSSLADAHVPLQQELDLLFGPLYDEFFTAAPSTPTYVHAKENNDNQAEKEHLQDDEVTNPFCTPVQEVSKSSSHNIEQVRGNASKLVQTRRQLATYPKMCMFALTVSTAEPKNIKEAMADSV
nr:hypothetical protein [Tanacetum cinerariifolium]